VRRAAREVEGEGSGRPRRIRTGLRAAAVAAAAIALLALGVGVERLASAARPQEEAPAPIADPQPASALEPLLLDRQGPSLTESLATVGSRWPGAVLNQAELQTHMGHVLRLDLPVALELFHPQQRDTCYLALVGVRGDEALVSDGGAAVSVPLSELERSWTRRAVFVWDESAFAGNRERWVRETLGRLGYLDGAAQIADAVRRFQEDTEISADGLVGPETLVALYGLGQTERPRLREGVS
jgi:hypothetical protein